MNDGNLSELRRQICHVNQMLPRADLVTMHSGNASGYDPVSGRIVIKPSGMDYEKITPENLVEVDLKTGDYSSSLRPSVDLPHHLYLYRHLTGINCIIHTHSNHATAFAACLRSIPMCLTAIADEFGGAIPCTPYVSNEGDRIGQAILKYRTSAPAILLGNHGVFAWGPTPQAALKAAIMVEDVAKTVALAMQIGDVRLIPPEEAVKWHNRYQYSYGQQAKVA